MTDTPLRRVRPTAGVPAPADKRFRRSSHRPGRRRGWQFWAIRAGWFAAAVAITTTLLWVLGNGVMDAGVFRIDRLEVQGQTHLAAADVRTLLDGLTGESIFRADLEEYRGRLLDSRWIENATLWRVFPSSIHVEVVERAPLAIGRLNGRFYLVDRAGVIDEAGPKYAELDLPVVDGLFPEGDGAMPDPARVDLLSRFLADIETTAGLRHRVSQIDVSDARNAVVLIDNEPARLQLGMSDFGARLLRYFEAYEAAQRRVAIADYYDLRFGDRIYVGPARLVRDARH
jgi:cell division septal protein FtsQ